MPQLEICCYSYTSAVLASSAGADRIELCGPGAGGLTPDRDTLVRCRSLDDIGLFIMIRPRAGDFCYSDKEFEQMKDSVRLAKNLGADVLHPDHTVDIARNTELRELAAPLQTTFHKAFDTCPDLEKALDAIVTCGMNRILTSGGQATALAGFAAISHLVAYADDRIAIMAGGGLRASNVNALHIPGLNEFHSSAILAGTDADLTEIQTLRRRIDAFSTK
jgi:copper homeostasis protein